jgi:hypothetical protein
MANKVVLIMKSREDFSWERLKSTVVPTCELINRRGSSILVNTPVLRRSAVYGVILHEINPGILRADRIFSHRFNTPHGMGSAGFGEVYKSVKKASSE